MNERKDLTMKKTFKIVGIVCLAVLIWIAIIAGMLFLFTKQAKKNIAEMTKDIEISTTEEADKDDQEIVVNITKNPSSGQQSTVDEYYDTMQEALLNATINLEPEEQYRRNIDEVIKQFESDEYVLLIYRSIKNKKEEAYNEVRFKIYTENGEKQYYFEKMRGTTAEYNSIYLGNAQEVVENCLVGSDIFGSMGVNPDEERFMYGAVREDFFEEGESIEELKVEGQKPDEIIEYESFGKTWYFWYYNDLQSDKSSSELKVTLKE